MSPLHSPVGLWTIYPPPTVGSRILADDQGIFHNRMTEGLLPLQPRALKESVDKGVTQEPPGASKTRTRKSGRNEWSHMNKSPARPLNPKSNLNGCMRFSRFISLFHSEGSTGRPMPGAEDERQSPPSRNLWRGVSDAGELAVGTSPK